MPLPKVAAALSGYAPNHNCSSHTVGCNFIFKHHVRSPMISTASGSGHAVPGRIICRSPEHPGTYPAGLRFLPRNIMPHAS